MLTNIITSFYYREALPAIINNYRETLTTPTKNGCLCRSGRLGPLPFRALHNNLRYMAFQLQAAHHQLICHQCIIAALALKEDPLYCILSTHISQTW